VTPEAPKKASADATLSEYGSAFTGANDGEDDGDREGDGEGEGVDVTLIETVWFVIFHIDILLSR